MPGDHVYMLNVCPHIERSNQITQTMKGVFTCSENSAIRPPRDQEDLVTLGPGGFGHLGTRRIWSPWDQEDLVRLRSAICPPWDQEDLVRLRSAIRPPWDQEDLVRLRGGWNRPVNSNIWG